MKGDIHSLYQEALYAQVTNKLSYEIIGLVALIDHIKRAANRYLRNEERIANTTTVNTEHSSKTVTNDINERLSELGSVPCANDSLIIAGVCSGFEPLTNLVNQESLGTLTAALQVQGGGGTNVLNDNTTSSSSNSDHSTINLPLGPQPSEQRAPTFVRYDPLIATTYFNNSSTAGGVIPTDLRGPRLAIESDIHLAVFPTLASCLVDLQFMPNDVYNGLEAIAENIDAWRVNLVTRIKQYASTINDLQSSTNSAIYTGDLNARSTSNILARLDHFTERLNQQDQCISNNRDDI